MRWIGLAVLLAACTHSPADTSDTGSSDTSSADTSVADTFDTGTGPTGEAHGVVRDLQDAPVANAQVNLCRTVCTTVRTDTQGHYAFDPLAVGAYSFDVVPSESSGLAEPLVPYTITDGADAQLDVALPALGSAVTLPATTGEIEVAPSLFLTVKQGDLTVTFGDPPTAVQGALVDSSDWPPFEGLSGTVLAVWYLSPVQADASGVGGLPVRIHNDFSVSPGHTVQLWRASYWDYSFVKVGDFTATDTDLVNADARLPELSTLVLVDPG